MTANNIDVAELISILQKMKGFGITLIDMDMVANEDSPGMNKLVLHPVKPESDGSILSFEERNIKREKDFADNKEFDITNPKLNSGGNEIFGLFDEVI
jgi:hypothetical protein